MVWAAAGQAYPASPPPHDTRAPRRSSERSRDARVAPTSFPRGHMIYDEWSKNERRFPCRASDERLAELHAEMLDRAGRYIGFPNSRVFDYSHLARFLKFNINNIGDPFHPNSGTNTCAIEQEVIHFFASLFRLPEKDRWGYVTNGGTEGNLYGIHQGRETFPDAVLVFSEESHYCLKKIANILRMPSKTVPCRAHGEIDYDAFADVLAGLDGRPCVINLNIGTTFLGAIDRPQRILEILEARKCRNFHIHCDAALFGPMLPFVEGAPVFDFRLPISSISFSGHKLLGSPIPCGLVLCRKSGVRAFDGSAEYVGSIDTTISGSRDGFSVLLIWDSIMRLGLPGLAQLTRESFALAETATRALAAIGATPQRNEFSNIVVFENPGPALALKWQLATRGDFAHIVALPGVTESMLDRFVGDVKAGKGRRQPC